MDKKSEFEYLKESIDKYNDALVDIFGEYELCISDNNIIIYLKSSSGKKYLYVPGSLEKDCICFYLFSDLLYLIPVALFLQSFLQGLQVLEVFLKSPQSFQKVFLP